MHRIMNYVQNIFNPPLYVTQFVKNKDLFIISLNMTNIIFTNHILKICYKLLTAIILNICDMLSLSKITQKYWRELKSYPNSKLNRLKNTKVKQT